MHGSYARSYSSSFEFGSKYSAGKWRGDREVQGGCFIIEAKDNGGLDQDGSDEGGEKRVEGSNI